MGSSAIRRFVCCAALAIVSAPCAPALAAEPRPSATAEQLAEQAYAEHAAGKDADAIATYLRAYELSKASAILFNIATICDRKLHEGQLAMDYYRRYIGAPDAQPELVRKATDRLTALKVESEADAAMKSRSAAVALVPAPAVPAPAPQPAAPPKVDEGPKPDAGEDRRASHGNAMRVAGVTVGAVGVVGVGASVVLGLLAKGKNDDANSVCSGSSCSTENGVTLSHDAGSLATASTVSFIAGLALVGGGVALFALAPKSGATVQLSLAPQLGLDRAGLQLGGTF